MFRILAIMLACLASSSAYELGLSRRAMLARVAAAGPLAAVVGPAFAKECQTPECYAANRNMVGNAFLATAKRKETDQITGAGAFDPIGRQVGAAIDENGAAAAVGGGAYSKELALGSVAAVAAEPVDRIAVRAPLAPSHTSAIPLRLAFLSPLPSHASPTACSTQIPQAVKSKAMARLMQ